MNLRENAHLDHLTPIIPKIVEKKKIMKAFQGTGFEMGSRKGLLPGMNRVICTDSHNYKYEIIIYRGRTRSNSFNCDFRVMGCDFIIVPSMHSFYVKSEKKWRQSFWIHRIGIGKTVPSQIGKKKI